MGKNRRVNLALNLDNIRCLLYGKSQSDNVPNNLYKRALLPEAPPIQDRNAFMRKWFSNVPAIGVLLSSWEKDEKANTLDKKKRDNMLAEFSSGNLDRARQGILIFLREVGDYYDNQDIKQTAMYKDLLKTLSGQETVLPARDTLSLLSYYLDSLREAELAHPYLANIVSTLSIWITNALIDPSFGSAAYIITILILAALLRDRFPVKLLMPFDAAFAEDDFYTISMVVNSTCSNLAVLTNQFQSLDSYLQNEDDSIVLANGDTSGFWELQKKNIEKAKVLLDDTDIQALLPESVTLNRTSFTFLHHIPFVLDEAILESGEQIQKYKKNLFATSEGIQSLIHGTREIIECLQNLIYWHLIAACYNLPEKCTKVLQEFSEFLSPKLSFHFREHIKLVGGDPEFKIRDAERQFRLVIQKSTIQLPEFFYCVDISEKCRDYHPVINHPIQILSSNNDPEKTLITSFVEANKLLENLILARYHLVSAFLNQQDEICNSNHSEIIEQFTAVVMPYLDFPYWHIDTALICLMKACRICAKEYESFMRQPIVDAHQCMIFLFNLKKAIDIDSKTVSRTCRTEKQAYFKKCNIIKPYQTIFSTLARPLCLSTSKMPATN